MSLFNKTIPLREVLLTGGSGGASLLPGCTRTLRIAAPGGGGGGLQELHLRSVQIERGGGYSFSNSAVVGASRNRFFVWRATGSELQLREESLDVNLRGSRLRLCFPEATVLSVVTVERHRTSAGAARIEFLIPTSAATVRLLCRHPEQTRGSSLVEENVASVLTSLESNSAGCQCEALPRTSAALLRCATAAAGPNDQAYFAYGLANGSLLIVKLPPVKSSSSMGNSVVDSPQSFELKQTSALQKLWNGIVPTWRSDPNAVAADAPVDIAFYSSNSARCVPQLIALGRDHRLRLWDPESRECYSVLDLLECQPCLMSNGAVRPAMSSEGHRLRVYNASQSSGGVCDEGRLAVHMNLVDESSFILVFRASAAVGSTGRLSLNLWHCFPAECDSGIGGSAIVTDMLLQEDMMWILWTQQEENESEDLSNSAGSESNIIEGIHLANLQRVITLREEDPPAEFSLLPNQSIDDAVREIVFGGRFSLLAIRRALCSLRQEDPTMDVYEEFEQRGDLSAIIYRELLDAVAEHMEQDDMFEFEDLEVDERKFELLSAFYISLLQYHQLECRPLGLLADAATGMLGVVRVGLLSLLRPALPAERALLLPLCQMSAELLLNTSVTNMLEESRVASLLGGIDLAREFLTALGPDQCRSLQRRLLLAEGASETGGGCVQDPVEMLKVTLDAELSKCSIKGTNLISQLCCCLAQIRNISAALSLLLDLAQNDSEFEEEFYQAGDEGEGMEALYHPERCLFGSNFGAEMIASGVRQAIHARLFLALGALGCAVLCLRNAGAHLSSSEADILNDQLLGRGADLCRHLAVMAWLANANEEVVEPRQADICAAQLEALHLRPLLPGRAAAGMGAEPVRAGGSSGCSGRLLEAFYLRSAGEEIRAILSASHNWTIAAADSVPLWREFLPEVTARLASFLTPSSISTLIWETLLARAQYCTLRRLCALLEGWWEVDLPLQRLTRGIALLNTGEAEAAALALAECFELLGSSQVSTALKDILQLPSDDYRTSIQVRMFLSAMRVFEILEHREQVVFLARRALRLLTSVSSNGENELVDNDEFYVALHTAVFKHELALGREPAALAALRSVPERSGQRECLRQLVVTLCERRELRRLVSLELSGLEDDLVAIVEQRARAAEPQQTIGYYELLYSFHIARGNYRRAGAAMFERAVRLAREPLQQLIGSGGGGSVTEALLLQARSLLAALNCLRLVTSDYQWFVKQLAPGETSIDGADFDETATLEDEGYGERIDQQYAADEDEDDDKDDDEQTSCESRRLCIVPLNAVEQEYILCQARLRAASRGGGLLPAAACGPLSPMETLRALLQAGEWSQAVLVATRFQLSFQPLVETLASRCVRLSSSSGACESHEREALCDALDDAAGCEPLSNSALAWRLLQQLTLRLERSEASAECHIAVAERLLVRAYPLPAWLLAGLRTRDVAALLRLYMRADCVEEAFSEAMLCLQAAMAAPKAVCAAYCLPHTWLHQLLCGLKELGANVPHCAEWAVLLKAQIDKYLEMSTRLSSTLIASHSQQQLSRMI